MTGTAMPAMSEMTMGAPSTIPSCHSSFRVRDQGRLPQKVQPDGLEGVRHRVRPALWGGGGSPSHSLPATELDLATLACPGAPPPELSVPINAPCAQPHTGAQPSPTTAPILPALPGLTAAPGQPPLPVLHPHRDPRAVGPEEMHVGNLAQAEPAEEAATHGAAHAVAAPVVDLHDKGTTAGANLDNSCIWGWKRGTGQHGLLAATGHRPPASPSPPPAPTPSPAPGRASRPWPTAGSCWGNWPSSYPDEGQGARHH